MSLCLYLACSLGIVLSLLAVVSNRFMSMFSFGMLWLVYLSFLNVGQVFFSFQWDILLVETGFIAIFMMPKYNRKREKNKSEKFQRKYYIDYESDYLSFFSRELQKFLFFRLMNGTGVGKFIFKCPSWWDLSSIYWHLSGMPIPHMGSWLAHLAPYGLKQFLTAKT